MSCAHFLLYLHCHRKSVADIVGSVKLSSVPKSLVNFNVKQMLSEHVPSLVGIFLVQPLLAHILYILQGCGLFLLSLYRFYQSLR